MQSAIHPLEWLYEMINEIEDPDVRSYVLQEADSNQGRLQVLHEASLFLWRELCIRQLGADRGSITIAKLIFVDPQQEPPETEGATVVSHIEISGTIQWPNDMLVMIERLDPLIDTAIKTGLELFNIATLHLSSPDPDDHERPFGRTFSPSTN